ncbi:MAG: hypothetical protein LBB53_00080 [Prevotellaceae bacterium]|jgi:hypothetical protein|nr:hypothetical protein [Prevotellaceae bacterium]
MNYKVNLDLEISGSRLNPQTHEGVADVFPISKIALQNLSMSRSLGEAKSFEPLINKCKQGGEQELSKAEFDIFYQRVVCRLSTENKIAVAEMLSENGVDYEAYEAELPKIIRPQIPQI